MCNLKNELDGAQTPSQKARQRLRVWRETSNSAFFHSSEIADIITINATNILRPRNRTDGGVTLLRHPSLRQQKLNRISKQASHPTTPLGFLGKFRTSNMSPHFGQPASSTVLAIARSIS